jgi:hypothetical protein
MQYTPFNLIVAPLLAWMAVVSILVFDYVASVEIQERRRNRRMNQERHRLGLRASH